MTNTPTVPPMPFPVIRALVEIYYDFQGQRIITNNRIAMQSERNGITIEQLQQYGVIEISEKAKEFEEQVKKLLVKEMKNDQLWKEYFSKIQGIGPIISAGLHSYVGDIGRFDNISKLWQMAGFGMNTYCKKCKKYTSVEVEFTKRDGKTKTKAKRLQPMQKCPKCKRKTEPIIQRRVSGYMSNWNDKFKVLCWKIGQSFLKQQASKSGYRKLYDQFKAEERRKHPVKTTVGGRIMFNDGHVHNRALRKVIKVFLSHLWITMRQMQNLPVTQPYITTQPQHTMIQPFLDK